MNRERNLWDEEIPVWLVRKQSFFAEKNFATDQNIVTFKVEDAVRYLERQKIYVSTSTIYRLSKQKKIFSRNN